MIFDEYVCAFKKFLNKVISQAEVRTEAEVKFRREIPTSFIWVLSKVKRETSFFLNEDLIILEFIF